MNGFLVSPLGRHALSLAWVGRRVLAREGTDVSPPPVAHPESGDYVHVFPLLTVRFPPTLERGFSGGRRRPREGQLSRHLVLERGALQRPHASSPLDTVRQSFIHFCRWLHSLSRSLVSICYGPDPTLGPEPYGWAIG